ncbi:GNAT family N-acetyltransferase [Hyphomicrobium sp. D-2]|uniref:GNAT family N-acetyltransferase n=1 Tax=Hyphomicrobium sp. D-2 TaxID=3041621 RepID=UPI002456ECC2|nr:GNAT family N-acetyltransferase [Hyphomicrobium sp. D-2]MDH4982805.1 GNAT family N-acetyltransferase [Hyphomicrobium sp. D-2]
MAITIRRLNADDRDGWERLFRDYIRFYEAEVPDEVIALTWQRLLGEQDGMLGLLAVGADGNAVGLVNAVFHRSTWSPTEYCYLEDLFVDPAARGEGVGQMLIEAVYREADQRGATRTYWATQHNNETARRLYDKLATLSPFVQYRR